MSSYTQPVVYANGTILDTDAITENEESLKVFINQEVVTADINDGKLETVNVARGSIVQNNAEFQSSHISGIAELQEPANRSYATSTTKNNTQTSSIQNQDIANSGCIASLHSTADVLINMYVKYTVINNTALTNNGGQGNSLWQNEIKLKRVNVETGAEVTFPATDNYCFGPSGTSADTKDPVATGNPASQRSLMTTYKVTALPKGEYFFTATVNPHNETGYTTVKSMTVEVFYI